jgi:DNA-binding GntR family transcriptional regulator
MELQLLTADPAVEAVPATARAYRALERMIVTLELPPGSIATEGALIEKVGLGRTPVREAIQRLAWEGLVEVRPRAGLAIAPLHPTDWLRVLDARSGVEVVLARSAARFATHQTADQFHAAALAMQKAVIAGNVIAFLEADKALDDALSAAADNPFAARLAAPLQTHSRRFWFRYQADTGLAAAAERHVALIRAILNGDAAEAGDEAGQLMALLRRYAEAVATQ